MKPKRETIEAKYDALTTAAELIRSHGEDGGISQDDFPYPEKYYHRQKVFVYNLLMRKADALRSKYKNYFK